MNAFINMLLVAAIASLFAIQDAHTEERTMNKLQTSRPNVFFPPKDRNRFFR